MLYLPATLGVGFFKFIPRGTYLGETNRACAYWDTSSSFDGGFSVHNVRYRRD